MSGLVELSIALLELLEAEGRALRKATLNTGRALALLVGAGVFLLAGAALLGWALYQYLLTLTTPSLSAAIIGLLALLLGGALLWFSHRRNR